ncbi:hypothetical protein [Streptomyces radicis]|uniref:WXG100 family type VII secretion target n=1 Tax=Streptomyces radicis TaxID=1750517 RepID=A0A3A9WB71_9ACTN|nr:hypothetical protein [Streptomyces radicis]RKN10060.1 hypothetical protein D7319_09775 [Streptomyces radicis]RKN24402.1 hypothetical protein D7318_10955 [Streptomyces radicis]
MRPADWHPLTEGEDPVPGDWEMVREAAARYRRTADAIQRAKTLLGEVTNAENGWQSPAGEAFREKSTELSEDIWKAYGRYDAAANALADYWPHLQDAQEESLTLRTQAQDAQERADAATSQLGNLEDAADNDDMEDADRETNEQQQNDARSAQEGAEAELARLRTRLRTLVENKDTAAQRAADAIGEFIGGDGLTDGFWDRVGAALVVIGEWAGRIAAIAGVLALLVGWIPIIGQALAGILGTIALVATVFSLIGNIIQGKWLNVALDLIGIVTFGLGRSLGVAARAAGGGARFQAFRNVMRISTAGNRTARNAHAARVLGDSGGDLLALSRGGPSGLMGWGRATFQGIGDDVVRGISTVTSRSNWGQAFSQAGGAFRGGGLQGGIHQALGAADSAADLASLRRATDLGADVGGLGTAGGFQMANNAFGAAAGQYGLWAVDDGIATLGDWPSYAEGGGDLPESFVQEPVGAGEFTYQPAEAVAR